MSKVIVIVVIVETSLISRKTLIENYENLKHYIILISLTK
jgi:hypothetical protein